MASRTEKEVQKIVQERAAHRKILASVKEHVAKDNASYQQALAALNSNGVIGELDALVSLDGSTLKYTISQIDGAAKITTTAPTKIFMAKSTHSNEVNHGSHVIITCNASGSVSVTGDDIFNGAFKKGNVSESFGVSARKMKKDGAVKVAAFVEQKARVAQLLP